MEGCPSGAGWSPVRAFCTDWAFEFSPTEFLLETEQRLNLPTTTFPILGTTALKRGIWDPSPAPDGAPSPPEGRGFLEAVQYFPGEVRRTGKTVSPDR